MGWGLSVYRYGECGSFEGLDRECGTRHAYIPPPFSTSDGITIEPKRWYKKEYFSNSHIC